MEPGEWDSKLAPSAAGTRSSRLPLCQRQCRSRPYKRCLLVYPTCQFLLVVPFRHARAVSPRPSVNPEVKYRGSTPRKIFEMRLGVLDPHVIDAYAFYEVLPIFPMLSFHISLEFIILNLTRASMKLMCLHSDIEKKTWSFETLKAFIYLHVSLIHRLILHLLGIPRLLFMFVVNALGIPRHIVSRADHDPFLFYVAMIPGTILWLVSYGGKKESSVYGVIDHFFYSSLPEFYDILFQNFGGSLLPSPETISLLKEECKSLELGKGSCDCDNVFSGPPILILVHHMVVAVFLCLYLIIS